MEDFSQPPPVKPLIVFRNDKDLASFAILKSQNEKWRKIKSKTMVLKNYGKKDKDDFSYVIFTNLTNDTTGLDQNDVA